MLELYHFKLDPVATKSFTFLFSDEQKVCADAEGAAGVSFTITLTAVLKLSHPFAIWLT
ncbi:hypothetical protein D3C85_161490 [compost metagenome]